MCVLFFFFFKLKYMEMRVVALRLERSLQLIPSYREAKFCSSCALCFRDGGQSSKAEICSPQVP